MYAMNAILFTIIIPHKDSVHFLPKLFSSIPNLDSIEIILVDNSFNKISCKELGIDRPYRLLYSAPERGAGGARNVGIEHAHGKWLIFADADDYFSEQAFDVFFSKVNSEADLIYTCMDGIYIDTGIHSDRGNSYTKLVKGYLSGIIPETDLRFKFSSPCCKMVRHDLIKSYNLRYDEVTASNDMFFSLLCGFYAKRIEAIDKITYIATVSRGSLTKRRDYDVLSARYEVNLRYNKFLRENNYPEYQRSVLYYAISMCKTGIRPTLKVIRLLFKYRQNPCIGYRNWIKTRMKKKRKDIIDKQYITK